MAHKYCYSFKEGNATMRELLGGKGANLAEMTNIGLPVPFGFTISTEACTQYYEDGRKINDEIMAEAMSYVKLMEEANGKKFGDLKNPLLVSVRSGARASMPGMMDTILNLGLNDDVVAAMIAGNPDPKFERFVYDSYRRFIQMFSDVVMEVGKKYFEQLIDEMKAKKGVKFDVELTAADLKELAGQFKAEYKNQLGQDFPSDPVEQLKLAIEAVFKSWDNPRANVYRRDNDIPYSWGTAVNVMPMVFGNLNDNSGTGVAFTRDPATGEKKLMGEFLTNAQGEDVVAGVRTPMPIAEMEKLFPEAYAQFVKVCALLEDHYRDMQDMEFTVENGKLYMLQCRNGKRTAQAALKIACDLVDEGMIDEKQAVLMIDPRNLDTLLHPQFDAKALKDVPKVQDYLSDWAAIINGKTDEEYDRELTDYNNAVNKWQSIVDELKANNPEVEWDIINKKAGDYPWPPPKGRKSPFRPFGLHNSMVARITPYTVRGAIYYQGEEDAERADYYSVLNTAVINQWRNDFANPDMPFFGTETLTMAMAAVLQGENILFPFHHNAHH